MSLSDKNQSLGGYANMIGTPMLPTVHGPSLRDLIDHQLAQRRITKNETGIMNAAMQKATASMSSPQWRNNLICARLRVPEGNEIPLQHLSSALAGEKVFVFVVQKNTAVVFEDDVGLFPSDALITSLRLLIE